jgi:hypothetical protein
MGEFLFAPKEVPKGQVWHDVGQVQEPRIAIFAALLRVRLGGIRADVFATSICHDEDMTADKVLSFEMPHKPQVTGLLASVEVFMAGSGDEVVPIHGTASELIDAQGVLKQGKNGGHDGKPL